jgi:hypothetical protein
MAPLTQTLQTLTTMKTMMTFQPRTVGLLVTVLLAAGLFSGCSDRPSHKVVEGKAPMVVYAVKVHDSPWSSQVNREYWITDASGMGWTYITSAEFAIGDTVRFSPCR